MIREYWHVPPEWKGERCFIFGGGPSLKGFDGARVRGRGRVIAINNAGFDLVPFADVLFWSDKRWLDWNAGRLSEHHGRYKISRKFPHIDVGEHDVKTVKFRPSLTFSYNRAQVGGHCSGSSALNLAGHFGIREVILLGFDMRTNGNYHTDHKLPAQPNQHAEKFIPHLNLMAPVLADNGIRVINCTMGSALQCFEMGNIDDYA